MLKMKKQPQLYPTWSLGPSPKENVLATLWF